MIKTPKVTLLTWTNNPLETVYSVWEASKGEGPLISPEEVKRTVDPEEVEKLFRAVIAQRIPIGEHVDFVFMLENISVSWREQAVRHRIGTKASPERVGADIVMGEISDLADSSWWSQCFVGDTRIRLLDGTMPTIQELAERGGEFWVYSCDGEGRVVPGRGHSARKTGCKDIVEVELDNGEKVRCTSDHLWLGRDGEYVEAGCLKPGASLMPLYTDLDEYGYEQHYVPGDNAWAYTHQVVDRVVNGEFPDGWVIHHASFDKLNNDPGRLERMGKQDHIDFHAALIVERMNSDPEGHAKSLSKGQKRRWEALSECERAEWRERVAKAREAIDPARRDAVARELMDGRWSDGVWRSKMAPILASNGAKTKGRKQSDEERQRRSEAAKKRFARQKAQGEVPLGFNHKVAAVTILGEQSDVYDVTVEKYHNFALGAGVFVHNSMRIQDMSTFADNEAYRIPDAVIDHADPRAKQIFTNTMSMIGAAYQSLVKIGIPMEDARELIPLGAQHRMSWKLNIGALQHIVSKRGCWILQLGTWGPIITGMIKELTRKVHPIFAELVTPPCLKGDDFTGCVYQEECRRRYTGDDALPPCPLHLNYHELPGEYSKTLPGELDAVDVPRKAEMVKRAEDYREFWGRDPYTGRRLK